MRRIREQKEFLRLVQKIHNSDHVDSVRALLGEPDLVGGSDPDAGFDFVWEYHRRLRDDADVAFAFSNDRVVCSWFRHEGTFTRNPPAESALWKP